MASIQHNKGLIATLVLILFTAGLFGLYQLQKQQVSNQQTQHSERSAKPAYQTGKAFEAIDPEQPAKQSSSKTTDELISEADQIIANANAIVAKNNLGEIDLTDEEKRAVGERVANIERKINELRKQLDQ